METNDMKKGSYADGAVDNLNSAGFVIDHKNLIKLTSEITGSNENNKNELGDQSNLASCSTNTSDEPPAISLATPSTSQYKERCDSPALDSKWQNFLTDVFTRPQPPMSKKSPTSLSKTSRLSPQPEEPGVSTPEKQLSKAQKKRQRKKKQLTSRLDRIMSAKEKCEECCDNSTISTTDGLKKEKELSYLVGTSNSKSCEPPSVSPVRSSTSQDNEKCDPLAIVPKLKTDDCVPQPPMVEKSLNSSSKKRTRSPEPGKSRKKTRRGKRGGKQFPTAAGGPSQPDLQNDSSSDSTAPSDGNETVSVTTEKGVGKKSANIVTCDVETKPMPSGSTPCSLSINNPEQSTSSVESSSSNCNIKKTSDQSKIKHSEENVSISSNPIQTLIRDRPGASSSSSGGVNRPRQDRNWDENVSTSSNTSQALNRDRPVAQSSSSRGVKRPREDGNGSGWPMPYQYVALDCEFVGVGDRGKTSALGRCSIVDYYGQVIIDIFSRPEEQITDYRTPWSGLTPFHMRNAVPFESARRRINQIIAGKIIIGHAIHNDFQVLKLTPARENIRDTMTSAKLKAMMGEGTTKCSLKRMAAALLGRAIQMKSRQGHCSVEDARASLDLFKLVEREWDGELKPTRKRQRVLSETESYLDDAYWLFDE